MTRTTAAIIAALSVALLCAVGLLLKMQMDARKPGVTQQTIVAGGEKTASVSGDVGVPTGMDAFGVTVFAEGTGYMALTDADGRFVVSGLKPGTYKFRATRPDLVSAEMEEVTVTNADLEKEQPFRELIRVLMDSNGDSDASEIMLSTLGAIHGRATISGSGDQSGTTVLLEGTRHRTVTDAEGNYEIINVEPGNYDLVFIRSGFGQIRKGITIVAGQPMEVSAVSLSAREDATEGDRSISGRVEILTSDGSAMSDHGAVRVTVEGTSFSATPDSEGRFQLTGLPPRLLTVSASAPGYLLERKAVANLRDQTEATVDLVLLEDTTATAGTSIVRGRVLLASLRGGTRGTGGVAVSIAGTSHIAFTDASGNYQIENVEAGKHDLIATFNGYKTGAIEGLEVAASGETPAPDLTLEEDVPAPVVVATSPDNGQSNVTIAEPTTAIIQFSMNMDASSVIAAINVSPKVSFRVRSEGGQDVYAIDFDAVPPGDGGVALRYGTRYTVTIADTASSMTGVPMEEPYEFSFTTGYAEIIATTPGDNAAGITMNFDRPISISFNAPIDPDSISPDDIVFNPSLSSNPNINMRRDAKSGWTTIFVSGFAQPDVKYTMTVRRGVKTVTGDRVRNLPYRMTFTTAKWTDLGTLYNAGDNGSRRDDARRERERSRRR